MKTKKKNRLFKLAKTGIDYVGHRGDVCRGAYITSDSGIYYLSKKGKWSWGVGKEEENYFWETEHDASEFLETINKGKK